MVPGTEKQKGFSLSVNKDRQMSHLLKHGLICAVQKYVHSSGSLRRGNQLSLSGTPTGETVFNFTRLQLSYRPQELRRQRKGKKLFQAEVPARAKHGVPSLP